MLLTLLAASLLVAGACSSDGDAASPAGDRDLSGLWEEDSAEPYPFSGEIPPLEATPIDGIYVRDVPIADTGEPIPCRRCPPYKIYAGEARLRLERGRFYVDEDGSQFGSEGHFLVDGDTITLFNDPICPRERVTYGYSLDDGTLSFEFQRDPCAFQNLRGRYLTSYRWSRT